MTFGRRPLSYLLTLMGVALGWAGGRCHSPHGTARADDVARVGAPSADTTCTDRLAMRANANLVEQVSDTRKELDRVRQAASDSERRSAARSSGLPGRLAVAREEWARMARDGAIRFQLPCASWDSTRHLVLKTTASDSDTETVTRAELDRRAEAAGLGAEELETLGDAHRRAHARVWAQMRAACETRPAVRTALARRRGLDDHDKIEICRDAFLDVAEAHSRVALQDAAFGTAAGRGRERASGEEELVAVTLTGATDVLFDEVTRALGRERAVRAADLGVLCIDEVVYDVREPSPPAEQGEEG